MKCAHCGATENLTKDHIIPQWIYRRWHHLKLNGYKMKPLGQSNIQMLCDDCNSRKGGRIEIANEESLKFWLAIREAIDQAINKALS